MVPKHNLHEHLYRFTNFIMSIPNAIYPAVLVKLTFLLPWEKVIFSGLLVLHDESRRRELNGYVVHTGGRMTFPQESLVGGGSKGRWSVGWSVRRRKGGRVEILGSLPVSNLLDLVYRDGHPGGAWLLESPGVVVPAVG